MIQVGMIAASAAAIAKLCSIAQKQGPLLKTLSEWASGGVICASMPVAIALGVSAKVAAVATATFLVTSALFNSGFKMKLAFAATSIGGAITYVTLASCGPTIAAIIGIMSSLYVLNLMKPAQD